MPFCLVNMVKRTYFRGRNREWSEEQWEPDFPPGYEFEVCGHKGDAKGDPVKIQQLVRIYDHLTVPRTATQISELDATVEYFRRVPEDKDTRPPWKRRAVVGVIRG